MIDPNIANPLAQPTVSTVYKVTVTDDNCTLADAKSDQINITVNPLPVANFNFSSDNQCSGTSIQFTSLITNGTAPYTYKWDFEDSSTSTDPNPSHVFTSFGCSSVTYNVLLIVTDKYGCESQFKRTVTVKQQPDINFQDNNNLFDPFSNCSNASAANPVYQITLGNVSNSTCISSFSITWGDGTSANNVSFPILHTYSQLGAYSLVVTALGSNGCSSSKKYTIKNVSNPSGGIISPGSTTNLCAPTSNLQFEISKWGANSPGTTYEINYGDNSSIVTLTQEQLTGSSYFNPTNPSESVNYPIPHSYTKSSCPDLQFLVTLTVTNACGSTPFTAGNIIVLNKSVADFTMPPTACVNKSVLFTNNSIAGYSQNCSRNSIDTWDFGDGTPIQTTLPSLPQSISHIYTSPGLYFVKLTEQNFCATTSKTLPICIETPLLPEFTLNTPNSGCTPLTVTVANTTNELNACKPPTYLWIVDYTSGNCGTIPSISFTAGTDYNSKNPAFLFSNPGIYSLRLSVTNSCGTVVSNAQTITVKQPPTVTISNNGPICQTLASTVINPAATINNCGSLPLTYAWSFPGGNPASSSDANPGPISYNGTGDFNVSLIVTNACGPSAMVTNTFSIKPVPILTNPPLTQIICSGTQTNLVNLTSDKPNTNFSWTVSASPGITGYAEPASGLSIPASTITSNLTTQGTVTYAITPILNGCSGTLTTFVITVNPKPMVTNTLLSQTVCSGNPTGLVTLGSNVNGTAFNWTATTTASIISGYEGVGTSDIPVQTITNSGSLPEKVIYHIVPFFTLGQGCAGDPADYTITINPLPIVSATPAQQTICSGTASSAVNLSSNVSGTTYSWTTSSTAGISGAPAGGITSLIPSWTLTNTSAISGTVTVTVIPKTAKCTGMPLVYNIVVGSKMLVNPPVNQIICSGATTDPVNLTSNIAGATFTWTATATSGITGFVRSGVDVINSETLTNATFVDGTVTYMITPLSVGCVGSTLNYTVTVKPNPNVSNVPTNKTICSGSSANIQLTSKVSNTLFDWTASNTQGTITGFSPTGSGNILDVLGNAEIVTGKVSYIVTPNANGCVGLPQSFSVVINPTPTVDVIADQLKCKSDPTDAIVFTGTVPNTVYNWTNTQPGIGLPASGTGMIDPFLLANSGTSVLTATINVTPSFKNCNGPSKSFEIAVNPKAQVNRPVSQVICSGSSSLSVPFTSNNTGGTTTYTWTNDKPEIGLGANGIGDIGSFIAQNSTNSPIEALITVVPVFLNGGVNCTGPAEIFSISVLPMSLMNAPANQVICNNEAAFVNFSTLNTGGVASYTWTNSTPSINLRSTGTGNIGSFIAKNTTNIPVTASITVTPTFTLGGVGCPGLPQTFTITVNPSADVSFSTGNQTICTGENSLPVTLSSSTSGVSFDWTSDSPSGITGVTTSGTNTIPVQPLVNSTDAPIIITYIATATVAGGTSCPGAEYKYKITVNPRPLVTEKFTPEICSGSNFSIIPATGSANIVPSATTYTWSEPVIIPAGALSGAIAESAPQNTINQQLANLTNDYATVTYSVTPLFDECEGLPFEIIVTVKPAPVVDPTGDISICHGTLSTIIDFKGAVSGTVFKWTNSNVGIGLPTSGTGSVPVFSGVNLGFTPKIATITVTPFANGCVGSSKTFKITVNPLLPVSVSIASDANNICPGTAVLYTATPVNGGLNPVYEWKVNGVVVGAVGSSYSYVPENGDIVACKLLSDAICAIGNPAQSNVISMVVYSDLPAKIAIVESANDICPGESATYTATPDNGGSNPAYLWFVNGLSVGANVPLYSYEPVNGDVVTCQLVSSNICSSSRVILSAPVTMRVLPPGLLPQFTIDPLNDCAPIKVILKDNSLSGGLDYIWDFGDGETYKSDHPVDVPHTFENFTAAPIEFTVSLKIFTRYTHCFNVLTKTIIVKPELFAGSPVSYMGCSPFIQKFENAYAGAKSYRWIDSKKTVLSTQLQPTLTFTASKGRDSTHVVYLIAESYTGCFDTIVNTINVSPGLAMPSFTYSGKADCRSVTYTFKNTGPEGASLFIWDFGDGTINKTYHANEQVTHTFFNGLNVAVPFNVILTATSGASCSLSVTHKIMVDPEYMAGYPVTFQGCNPLVRTFVNAYDGSRSYQWKSSDWRLLSTKMSPTFTFDASIGHDSTHLVYLIAESLNGCIDTIVNNIIVRAANKADFSAIPTTGCAPLSVQFTNASSPEINGYEWDFDDGSDCSIVENPGHIFIDPKGLDRSYNVSLIAFNQYGCADTAFQEIHLLPTPQMDFVAWPIVQTYPDRTVKLTNLTPLGNWTYSWNFGDQKPIINGLLSDYLFDLPGEYVISLTAKGAQCENTKRVKVTINPGAPSALFEPDTTGCAPLKVKFRNNSQNGNRYEWDFGNGNQSVDFSPSTIFYDEGIYTVKLKVFNQFGVMSETERKIVLYPVPKALFKPLPYRVRIPAQSVTFFNSSENGSNYLWDFGDGEFSSDAQPIHQYTQTGVFDVTLYITSNEGCKDTFLLPDAVDVFSDGLKVPNAFMPNKLGANDGFYVAGDPRNTIFYPAVAVGDLIEYDLKIYNRWGNLLFVSQEAERGWNGYYNGILCPQDVYIWKIRCHFKSGSIVTKTGDVTLIQ